MKAPTPLYWYALREAADILDVSPEALRRKLERRVQHAADGVKEARVDGIRARKFGNHWRVSFGKAWTE
jgi:NAD+--asparagine ADP-ribosyltransferase